MIKKIVYSLLIMMSCYHHVGIQATWEELQEEVQRQIDYLIEHGQSIEEVFAFIDLGVKKGNRSIVLYYDSLRAIYGAPKIGSLSGVDIKWLHEIYKKNTQDRLNRTYVGYKIAKEYLQYQRDRPFIVSNDKSLEQEIQKEANALYDSYEKQTLIPFEISKLKAHLVDILNALRKKEQENEKKEHTYAQELELYKEKLAKASLGSKLYSWIVESAPTLKLNDLERDQQMALNLYNYLRELKGLPEVSSFEHIDESFIENISEVPSIDFNKWAATLNQLHDALLKSIISKKYPHTQLPSKENEPQEQEFQEEIEREQKEIEEEERKLKEALKRLEARRKALKSAHQ